MSKLSCPYCYHRIDRSKLAFLCTLRGAPGRSGCTREKDEARRSETGFDEPCRPAFTATGHRWLPVRQAACPECGGMSGIRACPCCHTPLSPDYGDSASPLIAMVGAKGTGKTVYLSALVHELRGGVRRRFGADVRLTGDRQGGEGAPVTWLDRNVELMFGQRQLAPETAQARNGRREPLVFEWRQEDSVLGRSVAKTSYLAFYDTAGEDLSSQDNSYDLRYLGAADALIVLLDPFMLGHARDLISVPREAITSTESSIDVLSRVTQVLRAAHGTGTRRKVKIPVAVAFAKMDAFFDLLGSDHPVVRVPRASPAYDETAGRETHEHVRALLHDWGSDDVDTHLRLNYHSFRYFAVSSLGAEPDYVRNTVDPGGVRPHRVDEPLVWLLSRFDVLPAREQR
jgi:hypothetical protein